VKKIIIAIAICLSLSSCASMKEFNKPTVDADGKREFRATAAYARGHH
jgi:uncharacterized protein YceK